MKIIRFVDEARAEFLYEVGYYESIEIGLGDKFIGSLRKASERALKFPLSGSPAPARTRKVIINRFPISLVYRPIADGIVIFAVAHHSRKPNYWINRISCEDSDDLVDG